MSITLENEYLRITIKKEGAELTSIFNKSKKKEMLWSADNQFWGRHAPVLFPIVGRLNKNQYVHQGRIYEMSQHGFARDKQFEIIAHNDTKVSLTLKSTPDTQQVYPFDFELTLIYELSNNEIIHSYKIKNRGEEEMLYSIGAHPAYILDNTFDQYHLQFHSLEPHLKRTLLQQGLLDNQIEYQLDNESKLTLSQELFLEDALVFENLQSDAISIVHGSEKILTMNFKGFPFFGIWTKPGAPFLCLEPWLGIADSVDYNEELSNKKGIQKLPTQEEAEHQYQVTIH